MYVFNFMNVFEYNDYKKFYLNYLHHLPKKGHGQFRRLADHLGVSPVIVSQVFKGDRQLNPEQAYDFCEFMGFGKLETQYFMLMVQKKEREHSASKNISEQLKEIQVQAQDLQNRIPQIKKLSEESKATYYSQWYYSAIRLYCDIGHGKSLEEISEHFLLPMNKVKMVTDFLIENNLCVDEKGLLKRTEISTHLNSKHPLVSRHHQNWRFKGFDRMDLIDEEELFFTGPMVLSHGAIQEIRQELVKTIEKITKKTAHSKSETLACLNIDWFKY